MLPPHRCAATTAYFNNRRNTRSPAARRTRHTGAAVGKYHAHAWPILSPLVSIQPSAAFCQADGHGHGHARGGHVLSRIAGRMGIFTGPSAAVNSSATWTVTAGVHMRDDDYIAAIDFTPLYHYFIIFD